MKVVIQSKNIELGEALKELIEQKINSLEKFAKKIFGHDYWDHFFGKGKPKVEAWVEVSKTTLHHRKGPFFYVECQMRFPGKSIRAESEKESIEAALDDVKEKLERQIIKYRKKIVAKYERGARKAKKKLKISKLAKIKEGKRVLQEGI